MLGRKKNIGYVYIASNKAMPDLVKIGMTGKAPASRLKELYTTGVPYPFQLHYAKRVKDPREVEKTLHHLFQAYRVSSKREFFALRADDAVRKTERVVNSIDKIRGSRKLGKFFLYMVLCGIAGFTLMKFDALTILREFAQSIRQ